MERISRLVVAAIALVALSAGSVLGFSGVNVGVNEALSIPVTSASSRQDVITYPHATYVSVHFLGFNLPEGDVVVVRSPDAKVKHSYSGKGRNNRSNFVASFVPGDTAIVEYIPAAARSSGGHEASGVAYTISGYSRGVAPPKLEAVCGGADQSLPAKCYQTSMASPGNTPLLPMYETSKAVARLLVNGTRLCTGWLLGSEGHLITNNHCIPDPASAVVTDFEFGAESASCSVECRSVLGCQGPVMPTTSEFVASSKAYDYTIVRLRAVDLSAYKYMQLRTGGPVANEKIYIPQHPIGFAKRIVSYVENGVPATVTGVGQTNACGTNEVLYVADTQDGSSGSPVIAQSDNAVVGLHHCGFSTVCTNSAVDVRDIVSDLRRQRVVIKDLTAEPAPTPTAAPSPAPTQTPAATSTPTTTAPTPTPTPSPTTAAPTPTPKPTEPTCAPSMGYCGNETDGPKCCQSGEFCMPFFPFMYGCVPAPAQCTAPQPGVNFDGNDLATVKSATHEDCCGLCASTLGCNAYSFEHYVPGGVSTCYLKTSAATKTKAPTRVSALVSARNTCATPPWGSCGSSQGTTCCPTGYYCEPAPVGARLYQCLPTPTQCLRQLTNVDFDGDDLLTVDDMYSDSCCEFCAAIPECVAYSFVPRLGGFGFGSCYLKSSIAGHRPAAGVLSERPN